MFRIPAYKTEDGIMSKVVSIFSVSADCVKGNFPRKLERLLKKINATLTDSVQPADMEIPWRATQESHRFKWNGLHYGWMHIIRKEGKFIQIALKLRYSNIALLSRRSRDWKKLNNAARNLFGQGRGFTVGAKKGNLFEEGNIKIQITTFTENRHAYIEIKIARDYFCS